MASALEAYRKRGVMEGVAPSGQSFRWRVLTDIEQVEFWGGFPSVKAKPKQEDQPERTLAELAKENSEFSRRLLARCVVEPLIVEAEAEAGDSSLPYSALFVQDVRWLEQRIQAGFSSPGGEADMATARGLLPGGSGGGD
jgi:hypothetical protein